MCVCVCANIYIYIPKSGPKMCKILQDVHKHNLCYIFLRVFAIFRETITQSNSYEYQENKLKFMYNSKNVVGAMDNEF